MACVGSFTSAPGTGEAAGNMPLLSTSHKMPFKYVSSPLKLAGGSIGFSRVAGFPLASRSLDLVIAVALEVRMYSVRGTLVNPPLVTANDNVTSAPVGLEKDRINASLNHQGEPGHQAETVT